MKNQIINRLENMAAEWKAQFENPPSLALTFSVSAADKLQLNGLELCDMAEIDPEALAFDVEVLEIGPVILRLDWPNDGPARLFIEREVPIA